MLDILLIELKVGSLLRTELHPLPQQSSYVEALTSSVTVFGDKAFRGLKVKLPKV